MGWLAGKVLPYLAGAAGIMILSLLAATAWLASSRDHYIAKHGQATEQVDSLLSDIEQARLTNTENRKAIAQLQAGTRWREQKAVERIQRERAANQKLETVLSKLQRDLQSAPCSGPDYVWPAAVYDRMRTGTGPASVPNPYRVREGADTSGVPAPDNDSRAEPAG